MAAASEQTKDPPRLMKEAFRPLSSPLTEGETRRSRPKKKKQKIEAKQQEEDAVRKEREWIRIQHANASRAEHWL